MRPLKAIVALSFAALTAFALGVQGTFAQENAAGQTGAKQTATARSASLVIRLLGKPRREFDKALGKPIGQDFIEYEYRLAGFKKFDAMYELDSGSSLAMGVEFTFPRANAPANWKVALSAVGLSPAGAELLPLGAAADRIGTCVKNVKGIPAGWVALWRPGMNALTFTERNSGLIDGIVAGAK